MFYVILSNSAGELDRREAQTEEGIKAALEDLVAACIFAEGDTIKIVAAE